MAFANQVWHSPKIERIQDTMKEILLWIAEVMERGKDAALNVADPRKFVHEILRLLRNEGKIVCLVTFVTCFIILFAYYSQ